MTVSRAKGLVIPEGFPMSVFWDSAKRLADDYDAQEGQLYSIKQEGDGWRVSCEITFILPETLYRSQYGPVYIYDAAGNMLSSLMYE